MENINFPKKFKVYLPLILLFVLLVFLMPRSTKFNYDYKKGEIWPYETLVAQFDFPILKTEGQLASEFENLSKTVVPYYTKDVSVEADVQMRVNAADLGKYSYIKPELASALSEVYSKGIKQKYVAEEDPKADNIAIGGEYIYILVNRKASKVPVSEVYEIDQARDYLRTVLRGLCPGVRIDSLFKSASMGALIQADLIYDRQMTDAMYRKSIEDISKTSGVFRTGQVIISDGDTVTAESMQILNSYKAEYEDSIGYSGHPFFLWAGNALIALALVFVLFLALYYCNNKIFGKTNKYLYVLLVFSLSAIAASAASKFDTDLFYVIPFTLVAFYLIAFFKKRLVLIVYIISLLPVLILAPNGLELFVMYLVAGTVGMFLFERFNRGWLQFVTAFFVFLTMALVWLAFRLVEGVNTLHQFSVVIDMALGSLLLVAGYPLVYLFEKIFRLVSASKLVELSDTSNKLLRLLADKAPGTFQHSLQVMNLADAAARSIDAYVPLVRAGALYHDIGKIANPHCFTENETAGVRFHEGLTPQESAREIIKHVSDGLALAEKHGLPQEIKDFIVTHHGTTLTGYFYTKYVNDGGDPEDIASFRYDGVKPATQEQVILMICDAVEAASRSLKNYSPESVSELVDRIIDSKADEGQFSDSVISLRDLNILRATIKSYLEQMYHARVAYPKRNAAK